MRVKLFYSNILETAGTITVSPGADASYPAYRLYDRHNGRLFKFSGLTTPSIIIGSGAADTLIIPGGLHNLSGLKVKLEKSATDSWPGTELFNYLVPDTLKVVQTFTLATGWWKLYVTASGGGNPGVIPQFAELFLGQSITLTRQPLKGSSFGTRYNNTTDKSEYGYPFIVNKGPNVKARSWKFSGINATALAELQAYLDIGGYKFFWVQDELGNWTWNVEVSHSDFTEYGADTNENPLYSFDMALMEIPS